MLHRAHPRAATPQRGAERRLRLRIPHLRRHPRLLPLHDEVPPLAGACGEQRSGGAPARVEPHARPAHRRRERLLLLTCLVEGEEGLVSQRFREGFPNPRGLGSVLLDLAHQLPGEGGAGDGLEDLGGAGGGHGGGGASGRRREGSLTSRFPDVGPFVWGPKSRPSEFCLYTGVVTNLTPSPCVSRRTCPRGGGCSRSCGTSTSPRQVVSPPRRLLGASTFQPPARPPPLVSSSPSL